MIYYKIFDGEKMLYTVYVNLEDAQNDFYKIPLEAHKIPCIKMFDDENKSFNKNIKLAKRR